MTPVVLGGGGDHDIAFLTDLLVLDAGIIGVASFKQWRVLEYLGFGFTWVLFAGWMADRYTPPRFWPALVFLHLYFTVFALIPFTHRLRAAGRNLVHFGLAAPNSLLAFGFAAHIVPAHGATWHLALITLAQACVFGSLARYAYRHDRGADAFVLLLTLAMFYLVATVPLLLPTSAVTSFWAVQSAVFAWGARLLRRPSVSLIALILGGAVAAWWLAIDVIGRAISTWPPSHSERWITAAVVLASASTLVRTISADMVGASRRAAMVAGTSVILSLAFVFANIELLFLMRADSGSAQLAAVSVLWTLAATALMLAGFRLRESLLRHAALWMFAATACKLFLLDVRGADRPARILAFLALGTILIGSSFLYHRYRPSSLSRLHGRAHRAPRGAGPAAVEVPASVAALLRGRHWADRGGRVQRRPVSRRARARALRARARDRDWRQRTSASLAFAPPRNPPRDARPQPGLTRSSRYA